MKASEFQTDYQHIIGHLDAIIREQGGELVQSHIEQIRGLARAGRRHGDKASLEAKRTLLSSIDEPTAYRVTHAFSLYFQLVNLCEERERMRRLRRSKEPSMSFRWLFRKLKEAKVSADDLAAIMANLEIEPVLTAHPTETKRRTVLAHLNRISDNWDEPEAVLETLWHTEEIREAKMTPLNEADNVHFYFNQTIFEAAAKFKAEFAASLEASYPELSSPGPFLKFASWVGGDRDGNPFVTPEISLEVMRRQEKVARGHYQAECRALTGELTHADRSSQPGATGEGLFQPYEKLRYKFSELAEKISEETISAPKLLQTLEGIQAELTKRGATRAASGRLDRLIRKVRTFKFHLAHLDFRDNSKKLDVAPEELEAEFRTIVEIQKEYGEGAAHRFILSMTRNADDILRLFKLATKTKCRRVDLVPLFETIEDLKNAPDMLQTLWSHKGYRKHLERRGDIQEVMVGYSDSNKDGGYMAANWILHESQRQIVEAGAKAGIQLRIFHGKGGSIDRGGGSSHRALRAQPHAASSGRIRITEQGEIISLKYSNPVIAERNFEQLTSAVIATQCLPGLRLAKSRVRAWEKVMRKLADSSEAAYRELVHDTPEFIEYFRQATPIDLIEHLRIGSRPSRRSAGAGIDELRAIPWVFSWTQSRHLLSAWYGIGSALHGLLEKDDGARETLQKMYKEWPYFHQLINNAEVSLAKTDLGIARAYAELVESDEVRDKIYGMISEEYERAVAGVLAITGHGKLLEDQPVLAESLERRNPHVDPLHFLQIRFLEQWRKGPEKLRTETLRRLLALTVNGIAFGMKSTG